MVQTEPRKQKAPGTGDVKPSSVLIITGLSGSGKTVALRAVEDQNFFCVDNLPVSLISALISNVAGRHSNGRIAIGIDIREKEFLANIDKVIARLRKKHKVEILFLDADTDVLIRRFKETRRPHPLGGNIEAAINRERESLSLLKQNADRVIDTSSFSPHQLRKNISSLFLSRDARKEMTITLISFGFKYGMPQNIDLLFDVRFLPNPNFVTALKPLNGTDKRVADYVFSHEVTIEFMKRLGDLLSFIIPQYVREGRTYLSIGIGCTGGNHRSPAILDSILKSIRNEAFEFNVIHRDMS